MSVSNTLAGVSHAVIFEVKPAGADGYSAYLAEAARLGPQLQELAGFVSIERFDNVTRAGWLLSLSMWRDEAALIAWRENPDHRTAQQRGRHGIFADYRIRVSQRVDAGGDLTLTEGGAPADAVSAQNFDSIQLPEHRIALIEGSYPRSGTQWCVIRDYAMYDRRQATASAAVASRI